MDWLVLGMIDEARDKAGRAKITAIFAGFEV